MTVAVTQDAEIVVRFMLEVLLRWSSNMASFGGLARKGSEGGFMPIGMHSLCLVDFTGSHGNQVTA